MAQDEREASDLLNAEAVPSLGDALRVWLKIGLLSFGGPAGQIAMMHKIVVEQRRWIDEARFLHALNYCMLLPGPEAQQLATYIGWLMHRMAGGLIAGILFVLPGAIVMLGLSVAYALYADLPLVAAAFLGVKAAVLIVVVEAVMRIGRKALGSPARYAIAAAAFLAIFAFAVPFPAIIVAGALIGLLGEVYRPHWFAANNGQTENKIQEATVIDGMAARGELSHTLPSLRRAIILIVVFAGLWLGPVAALQIGLGPDNVFAAIATFFSKLAVVTFGGAYAVLAYMAQQAVEAYHWLSSAEMLDGLGLAETTPGPLIMVTQFVGFLAAYRYGGALDPMTAGLLGAILTTWVTFAPCFLWIFLGAPYIEWLRENRHLRAALSGITAAVVGVILNLAVWFGLHVLFEQVERVTETGLALPVPHLSSIDLVSLGLTLLAAIAIFIIRLGIVRTLAICAGAGILTHFAFG